MKIVWLSDFDLKGSGYFNISVPLCEGLIRNGHELKAVGLGYRGDEHPYSFGIIPTTGVQESTAIIQNLATVWKFDVLVVALDLPVQEMVLYFLGNKEYGYVGVLPIEADPLCVSWAMVLMKMDKIMIISEFGTNEAKKMNLEAEHLHVGVDTKSWRFPTGEEKAMLRKSFGIAEDTFVVLTVADNQERKHLSRGFQIFSKFVKKVPNSKYLLVTRENNQVGWKLRDLAQQFEINDKVNIFERGMPFKELWALYAVADVFLLTSKAEGLGMPLLEAMATGLPCIATNCTAIAELLAEDRGLLIDPDYVYIDPFGNGHRYFASIKDGVKKLTAAYEMETAEMVKKARKYVEAKTWDITLEQMEKAVVAAKRPL